MSETKIDQNFENKTSSEEMMDKDTNPNHTDLNTETTQIQSEISLDIQKPLNEDVNNNDEEKFSSPQNSKLDDNRSNIKDSFAEKIYLIKSMKENIDIKYGLLIGLIKVNQIEVKEIVDAVLYLLVNGPFDMEQNFMIYSSQCVIHMLDVIQVVDSPLKAELLSVFIGLIRKSKCNLMMTMETNFIEKTLEMLKTADKMAADLLIEMLGIVASFSVSVKELKSIFQILKGSNHCWPVHSVELLNVLQQMPIRSGPDEFFNFPGSIGSAIAIPPISKWPYQNGWTFNCWIHLDPASAVNIDRDKPYLYCFRTNKGLGYSGHFVGSNLVITTMKMKDKGLQHCVKYNLQPRRWYMVSVVYVYNRWTKSEIRCYIDGELISQVEMPWQINTNEGFDRCFIGASPEQKTETLLTGQISCIYGFAESLNPHQIAAIYSLGPSYKGNFKFEAECPQNLSDSQRKSAFEGRLCHSLMFAYNPVACDRQLCLNQAPKINNPVFAHSSHALMTGNVRPVLTQSIYSTLHSLGGVRILFPLFSQLDFSYRLPNDGQAISNDVVPNIGARLINLLFELLYGSPAIRHQLVQSKGILLISYFISRSNLYLQLNSELLDSIIKLCLSLSQLHIEHLSKRQNPPAFADQLISLTTGPKFQYATVGSSNIRNVTNGSNNAITDYKVAVPPGSSHALELVKHVYDYLLSNTAMWIHASPEVQLKLHEFLANDFLSEGVVFNKTRCINAVLQCLNSIKYYYWLVNPRDRSGILSKIPESAPALNTEQITNIRSSIFQFIKKLMLKCHNGVLDEEMQGFLNYLTVVNEDDNIRHVLFFCVTLMSEQPSTMVPAFDHKHGIKVIFKLLASLDETVRIMALKLLGFYLQRSTYKRKQDSMVPHNLFTLIGERLLLYSPYLTMAMYNTLYEIMTEKMTLKISVTTHSIPDKTHHLENPALLKVIAHLIRQSKNTKELLQVRKMFLTDLNHLCNNSKENRRTVLQMSVWQDWLFILTPLSPQTPDQEQMLDAVLNLVRLLLHHAMKVEYGGWRVWIDTLAILHSKVAYHEFRRDMRKVYEQYEQDHSDHPSYSNIKHQHGINTASRASSSSGYRMSMEYGDENVKEERPSQSVDLAESVAKMIIDDIVGTACDLVTESAVAQSNTENQIFSPGPRSVPFRIPAFTWSQLHQRLLHDLLCSIESDLQIWKRSNNRNILEFVNATENQVYVINLVHLVTMLSDSLITCCGGLLPLLAAATSPSGDVDMLENGNGMAMSHAVCFLLRVMNIADIVVFASSLNFVELEQEKTMSNGGILRQCLRLVCTCAVRNCLENRFRDLHYQLFNESNLYEAHSSNEDSKFDDNLPPDPMQELMRGLRPRSDDVQVNELLLQNYPISDPEVLLQEMDINRLRAVVYRDVEEAKQAQFLALSIVYFLSVLMVSRYRDLLEPSPTYDSYSLESSVNRETNDQDRDKFEKLNHEKADVCATVEEEDEEIHYSQTENKTDTLRVEEEIEENVSEEIRNNQEDEEEDECDDDIYAREISFESDGRKSRISGNVSNEDSEESDSKNTSAAILDENENENEKTPPISSIQIDNHADNSSGRFQQFTSTLPQFPEQRVTDNRKHEIIDRDDEDYPKSNFPSSTSLTKRLEQALGGTAPLIREIFFDFSSYLSRTLIGSHGQELVSSGLVTLRQSTSVVEMVMLLCSQEWQNSLQKHAGLAFIELVNEGRLLAHASLDHTVRVANEAHFILSRMRAEDVQKHSEFTRLCAIMHQERQAEERLSEHLIASARTRDDELANKLKSRVESLVFSSHGVWASDQNEYNEFYRLDYWEDDSRRRRRFVSNPYGSTHPEAILPTASLSGDSPPIIHNKSKTEIFKNTLKELNLKSNVVAGVSINDNTMTSESGYGVTDEELFDAEKSEPRSNEDNQLEADLDSEQDLSESSYKIPDNKDSNQNKISDDTKSAQGIKKVSESETVTNNSLAKPINMDITGPVFLSTPAILLAPGVSVHGSVSITKSELYFEMDANNKNNIGLDQKVLCYMHHLHGKWHFSEIRAIFSRKFLHKNIALEIFVANRMAVMFAFPDQETVRKVIYVLPRVGIGIKYCVSQHRKSSLASPRQIFKLSNMTQRWQQREISNFDYLMYLNTIAGRTYNDLNQYPIFPWVLANYESETIDLSSPSNYRDLSSPIGALNPSRKKFFDNRFKNWDDDSQSAFHYGTHYSTAAFVLNYLVRVEPFTTLFLNLQSGKFDHADRTFHSVAQTWKNCQRDTSDVKELIPEFFYLPEMFTNSNDYRFGKSEDGNIVDDVILPKWAKTPEDFVRINRQALESELVSCQLHHWIDLIFGYKQRGPEAIRSTNVFCYLTYEGSVNWDEIKDPMIRQALEDQIRSFGQTPSQLVTEPHPPRNSALHVSPLMFTPVHTDLLMMLKFVSNSPIVWMTANVHPQSPLSAVLTVSANYVYGVNKWNHVAADLSRRPVAAQTSMPTSLAGALSLATSPTIQNSQSGNMQSSLNSYRMSSVDSPHPDKLHNYVSSNVQLPLSMDPLLSQTTLINKRSLGEGFDLCMRPHNMQFACTPDNRVIFAGGFWDKSFRIFSVETGRLLQVVYGHFGVVVCIARSECGFNQDCYIVTGSTDCTIMLWLWGNRQHALLGDFNCRESAQPRMTITGHQAEIVCVQISGELGIIVSASKDSRCLIHTIQGELLRSLLLSDSFVDPYRLVISREGYILLAAKPCTVLLYTINGKSIGHLLNSDENMPLRPNMELDSSKMKNYQHSSISAMALTKDGDYVALSSNDGFVRIRRCHNLELVHSYPRCDAAITSLAITTDQRFILVGLCNGTIVIFNVDFNKWHHEYRDRYPAL